MPGIPSLFCFGPYNPLQIPGLALWLKADAITGHNDGDVVSTWSDQSGNGNDFLQATGGVQPLYKTSIINGLPTVLFDGVDDFMSLGSVPSQPPTTLFVVVQPTLSSSAQKNYATIFHSTGGVMYPRLSTSVWGTFTFGGGDLGLNALTSGSNYLLELTNQNNLTILYQKGTQVTNRAQSDQPPGGVSSGLGKDLITSNRQYAGHIAELLDYNTILSNADRTNVENYLIAKWAL